MTSDPSSDGNGTALFTTPVGPRPPRLPVRKHPAFPAPLPCSALCATFCSSPLVRFRSGALLFRLRSQMYRAFPASKRPCSAVEPRASRRLACAHRRAHAFAPLRALVRTFFRARVRHGCGAHPCLRCRGVCRALSSRPCRARASRFDDVFSHQRPLLHRRAEVARFRKFPALRPATAARAFVLRPVSPAQAAADIRKAGLDVPFPRKSRPLNARPVETPLSALSSRPALCSDPRRIMQLHRLLLRRAVAVIIASSLKKYFHNHCFSVAMHATVRQNADASFSPHPKTVDFPEFNMIKKQRTLIIMLLLHMRD